MLDAENLITLDGLIVDADTGDIIEELTDLTPAERIERRHGEYLHAKKQAEDWTAARQLLGRALLADLATLGVKASRENYGSVTAVPDTETRSVKAQRVYEAAEAGAFTEHGQADDGNNGAATHDPEDLILFAAKTLDADRVETWITNHIVDEGLRAALKLALIDVSPRAGYALVKLAKEPAPRIRKVAAE